MRGWVDGSCLWRFANPRLPIKQCNAGACRVDRRQRRWIRGIGSPFSVILARSVMAIWAAMICGRQAGSDDMRQVTLGLGVRVAERAITMPVRGISSTRS